MHTNSGHVVLNNGVAMPILGFGVYQIPDLAMCERSVVDALHTGYRLIDTAAAYQNEKAVGRAIQSSGVPREDIFVTTKLWIQDAGYDKAKRAFDRSLKRLGLDVIDLYLIHQPFGDVHGAWRAMEELHREGRVRAIGLSNFAPDRVIDIMLHNETVPAINQVETHPFCQQLEAHEFLRKKEVQIESWGPFAEGRNDIFLNPTLQAIGTKYRKTVAQVILRWLIERQVVVIPKSVRKDRIVENFDVFDFTLTREDMASIAALDTGKSLFLDHRNPETVEYLGTVKFDT